MYRRKASTFCVFTEHSAPISITSPAGEKGIRERKRGKIKGGID